MRPEGQGSDWQKRELEGGEGCDRRCDGTKRQHDRIWTLTFESGIQLSVKPHLASAARPVGRWEVALGDFAGELWRCFFEGEGV